jgi:hypothetical protein
LFLILASTSEARFLDRLLDAFPNRMKRNVGRNFFVWEWQLYFPGEQYRKTFPDLPGPD